MGEGSPNFLNSNICHKVAWNNNAVTCLFIAKVWDGVCVSPDTIGAS